MNALRGIRSGRLLALLLAALLLGLLADALRTERVVFPRQDLPEFTISPAP